MILLALGLEVARSHLNRPYRWGGDNPMQGFDCSGLIIEILKSCGLFPRGTDDTAEGLRKRYPAVSLATLAPGDLVFWPDVLGSNAKARHVEMVYTVIEGKVFTIGASGGGSKTVDLAAAIGNDAYVKVRPMSEGARWACRPF